MPTMTNPETGETKEISMEELMEAMRGGKMTVQQQVHHADGTVTSSAIYGNDVGDGIDRSLNVFGTMGDIFKPALQMAKRIQEADENAENLFCMDDSDADYEVTIDDTSMPIMHIVSCTKESVTISRYIRDERKTVGKPMSEMNILFENGEITATLEEIQENKLALFAFGVHELRRILRERGVLQELHRIGNKSSGVMITAVSEDDIDARIVRGKARPDLPCLMFGGLFAQELEDAVMMRPYMDEMMSDMMMSGMSLEEKIEAAENGDPDIMEHLAQMYLSGDDEVAQDFKKSAYWWEKLANTGNAIGQFNIGLCYAKGCGVKRDFNKAAEWMKKSAENGDEDAPALLEKYTKAAEAMKKIDCGDAQAQADLAGVLMALAGSLEQAGTTEDDYEQAFELSQKSASQNNGDGLWTLALSYEHGRGTEQNIEKAIECYRKGAELGHAPSQHSLACYYFRGDVLEQDNKKAFELCMKSAEQGYGLAMRDVGRSYQFGNGVTGNMKTAVEWYEKALEVIDDPELEEKTAIFKMIGENDEHWDEDYSGTDENNFDDEDDSELPDGFMAALEAFEEAEEYENELADEGVLPDAPRPGNGVMDLSAEEFPRIAQKAEDGDERAIAIIEKMKAANDLG